MTPLRSKVWLIVFTALSILESQAITYTFTGEITSVEEGSYHFQIGQTFSGWFLYDPVLYADNYQFGFGGAAMTVDGAGYFSITHFLSFGASSGGMGVTGYGWPLSFYGDIFLNLSDGVVTGGSVGMHSDEFNFHDGGFSGIIHPAIYPASVSVPDQSNSAGLLLLGLIPVVTILGRGGGARWQASVGREQTNL